MCIENIKLYLPFLTYIFPIPQQSNPIEKSTWSSVLSRPTTKLCICDVLDSLSSILAQKQNRINLFSPLF